MDTPNIWQLQSRRDTEGLAEALGHADSEVRERAATALRALDALEAIPALEAALAVEEDWQTQSSLALAIKHLSRETRIDELIAQHNLDGLIRMLYSPRVDDVIEASNALGDLGDRMASEALVVVFRNALIPDAVRLAAARALIKLESAPAVVTLLAALVRDEWDVRRNAAAVLGQLRATWSVEALIEAIDDPNDIVRRTILAALRRIGTPEALQAVEDAGDHPESPPEE